MCLKSEKLNWSKLKYTLPLSQKIKNIAKIYLKINDCDVEEFVVIDDNLNKESIDNIITDFTSVMNKVSFEAVPRNTFKPYVKSYSTNELQIFRKRRDEKDRAWVTLGRPRYNDFEILVSYKEAKRNFRRVKRRAETAYELKEEHDIKNAEGINQNYFWHLVRKVHKKYSSKPFIPVLNNNGVLSQIVQESVDAFAEEFSFLSKPTEDEVFDAVFKSQVDDVIRSIDAGEIVWNSSMFDVPFSVDELMTVRNSKLKCRKAAGWDLLTVEHIKQAGFGLMEILTSVFNAMIKRLHVPKDFKRGI